ncbi:hypothetical protein TWF703_005093 [Orbilia oligospora]|uniref:Uncharacterized protein n=1 Tax=Orbilia oligospora TaxID=2813651 RepID=A0A7C8NJJ0_ORBOL|nr:hypothetical protein TWF703_005093 [Orbilia oligospora]
MAGWCTSPSGGLNGSAITTTIDRHGHRQHCHDERVDERCHSLSDGNGDTNNNSRVGLGPPRTGCGGCSHRAAIVGLGLVEDEGGGWAERGSRGGV